MLQESYAKVRTIGYTKYLYMRGQYFLKVFNGTTTQFLPVNFLVPILFKQG